MFREETVSVRVPRSLLPEIRRQLLDHARRQASANQHSSEQSERLQKRLESDLSIGDISIVQADALDLLGACSNLSSPPGVVVLDPWYWKEQAKKRLSDARFWAKLLDASRFANHIFLWGTWRFVFETLQCIPSGFEAKHALVWHFQNSPGRGAGWRTSHNHVLHICKRGVKLNAQNFLTDEQKTRLQNGTLKYYPAPPDTIISPLEIGYINRPAQTEHPAQKPVKVIKHLLQMVSASETTVVDPMCGSGTTGEAAKLLGMKAILGDHNRTYVAIARKRLV